MTAPTRFPYGISTNTPIQNLANFGMPDPTEWHVVFDDFWSYTAGFWTVTETGSGSRALTSGNGGLLLITNAAADNDRNFFQSVVGTFLPAAGKKLFFKARFKVSDATQSDFVMGLQIIDTTPLDATDGIYFQKDDGDANLDVYVRKNATTGSNSAAAIATVVADTFLTVGFEFDGVQNVNYFVDDIKLGTLLATSAYLPDAAIAMSFGIQNGEGVAKTMTVDYVFAAMER